MDWILMNVVTDALRTLEVNCNEDRGKNADGNCFAVTIEKEKRKDFIEHCNRAIPSLNIDHDVISKLSNVDDVFKFRLVEKTERIDLLKFYVDELPSKIYDLLVSRPVYTFAKFSGNEIVDAFFRVADKSRLNTLADAIRVVSVKSDNPLGKNLPSLDIVGKLMSFMNRTLASSTE